MNTEDIIHEAGIKLLTLKFDYVSNNGDPEESRTPLTRMRTWCPNR